MIATAEMTPNACTAVFPVTVKAEKDLETDKGAVFVLPALQDQSNAISSMRTPYVKVEKLDPCSPLIQIREADIYPHNSDLGDDNEYIACFVQKCELRDCVSEDVKLVDKKEILPDGDIYSLFEDDVEDLTPFSGFPALELSDTAFCKSLENLKFLEQALASNSYKPPPHLSRKESKPFNIKTEKMFVPVQGVGGPIDKSEGWISSLSCDAPSSNFTRVLTFSSSTLLCDAAAETIDQRCKGALIEDLSTVLDHEMEDLCPCLCKVLTNLTRCLATVQVLRKAKLDALQDLLTQLKKDELVMYLKTFGRSPVLEAVLARFGADLRAKNFEDSVPSCVESQSTSPHLHPLLGLVPSLYKSVGCPQLAHISVREQDGACKFVFGNGERTCEYIVLLTEEERFPMSGPLHDQVSGVLSSFLKEMKDPDGLFCTQGTAAAAAAAEEVVPDVRSCCTIEYESVLRPHSACPRSYRQTIEKQLYDRSLDATLQAGEGCNAPCPAERFELIWEQDEAPPQHEQETPSHKTAVTQESKKTKLKKFRSTSTHFGSHRRRKKGRYHNYHKSKKASIDPTIESVPSNFVESNLPSGYAETPTLDGVVRTEPRRGYYRGKRGRRGRGRGRGASRAGRPPGRPPRQTSLSGSRDVEGPCIPNHHKDAGVAGRMDTASEVLQGNFTIDLDSGTTDEISSDVATDQVMSGNATGDANFPRAGEKRKLSPHSPEGDDRPQKRGRTDVSLGHSEKDANSSSSDSWISSQACERSLNENFSSKKKLSSRNPGSKSTSLRALRIIEDSVSKKIVSVEKVNSNVTSDVTVSGEHSTAAQGDVPVEGSAEKSSIYVDQQLLKLKLQKIALAKKKRDLEWERRNSGNGIHNMDNGNHDMDNGIHDMDNGIHDMDNGIHNMDNGIHDMENGLREMDNGIHEMDNGIHEMDNRIHEMDNGDHEMDNGIHEMDNGIHETRLTDVSEGRTELSSSRENTRKKTRHLRHFRKTNGLVAPRGLLNTQDAHRAMEDMEAHSSEQSVCSTKRQDSYDSFLLESASDAQSGACVEQSSLLKPQADASLVKRLALVSLMQKISSYYAQDYFGSPDSESPTAELGLGEEAEWERDEAEWEEEGTEWESDANMEEFPLPPDETEQQPASHSPAVQSTIQYSPSFDDLTEPLDDALPLSQAESIARSAECLSGPSESFDQLWKSLENSESVGREFLNSVTSPEESVDVESPEPAIDVSGFESFDELMRHTGGLLHVSKPVAHTGVSASTLLGSDGRALAANTTAEAQQALEVTQLGNSLPRGLSPEARHLPLSSDKTTNDGEQCQTLDGPHTSVCGAATPLDEPASVSTFGLSDVANDVSSRENVHHKTPSLTSSLSGLADGLGTPSVGLDAPRSCTNEESNHLTSDTTTAAALEYESLSCSLRGKTSPEGETSGLREGPHMYKSKEGASEDIQGSSGGDGELDKGQRGSLTVSKKPLHVPEKQSLKHYHGRSRGMLERSCSPGGKRTPLHDGAGRKTSAKKENMYSVLRQRQRLQAAYRKQTSGELEVLQESLPDTDVPPPPVAGANLQKKESLSPVPSQSRHRKYYYKYGKKYSQKFNSFEKYLEALDQDTSADASKLRDRTERQRLPDVEPVSTINILKRIRFVPLKRKLQKYYCPPTDGQTWEQQKASHSQTAAGASGEDTSLATPNENNAQAAGKLIPDVAPDGEFVVGASKDTTEGAPCDKETNGDDVNGSSLKSLKAFRKELADANRDKSSSLRQLKGIVETLGRRKNYRNRSCTESAVVPDSVPCNVKVDCTNFDDFLDCERILHENSDTVVSQKLALEKVLLKFYRAESPSNVPSAVAEASQNLLHPSKINSADDACLQQCSDESGVHPSNKSKSLGSTETSLMSSSKNDQVFNVSRPAAESSSSFVSNDSSSAEEPLLSSPLDNTCEASSSSSVSGGFSVPERPNIESHSETAADMEGVGTNNGNLENPMDKRIVADASATANCDPDFIGRSTSVPPQTNGQVNEYFSGASPQSEDRSAVGPSQLCSFDDLIKASLGRDAGKLKVNLETTVPSIASEDVGVQLCFGLEEDEKKRESEALDNNAPDLVQDVRSQVTQGSHSGHIFSPTAASSFSWPDKDEECSRRNVDITSSSWSDLEDDNALGPTDGQGIEQSSPLSTPALSSDPAWPSERCTNNKCVDSSGQNSHPIGLQEHFSFEPRCEGMDTSVKPTTNVVPGREHIEESVKSTPPSSSLCPEGGACDAARARPAGTEPTTSTSLRSDALLLSLRLSNSAGVEKAVPCGAPGRKSTPSSIPGDETRHKSSLRDLKNLARVKERPSDNSSVAERDHATCPEQIFTNFDEFVEFEEEMKITRAVEKVEVASGNGPGKPLDAPVMLESEDAVTLPSDLCGVPS